MADQNYHQRGLTDSRSVNQMYENQYNYGTPNQPNAGYASNSIPYQPQSYSSSYYPGGSYGSGYGQQYAQHMQAQLEQQRAQTRQKYGELAQYAPDGIIGGKDQAQDIRIALTRAEWADYKKRFLPIEEELIGMVGNQELLNQRVGRSQAAVSTAFDRQQSQQQMMEQRYGLQISPQARAHMDRKSGIMKAAAMADAANDTRRDYRSMEMEILGG